MEAAPLSAVSIDKGVSVTFADSDGEIKYIDLELGPVEFMDDIGRFAETVESAQDGNDRIVHLLESKLLDLNLDKTNYLVIGSRKQSKKLKKELENKPLTISGHPMKEVKTLKYLGDNLCSTIEESIHQTVLKRIGIAKKSISEIRAVIEDKRAKHIGGFNVALEIWDAAIVPMLLNNAETWISINKKNHENTG